MTVQKAHALYPSLRVLDNAITQMQELKHALDDERCLEFIETQGPPVKNGRALQMTVGGLTVKITLTGLSPAMAASELEKMKQGLAHPVRSAAAARYMELQEQLSLLFSNAVEEIEDACRRYPSIRQFQTMITLLSAYKAIVGGVLVAEAVSRCRATWTKGLKDRSECRRPRDLSPQTTLFIKERGISNRHTTSLY